MEPALCQLYRHTFVPYILQLSPAVLSTIQGEVHIVSGVDLLKSKRICSRDTMHRAHRALLTIMRYIHLSHPLTRCQFTYSLLSSFFRFDVQVH